MSTRQAKRGGRRGRGGPPLHERIAPGYTQDHDGYKHQSRDAPIPHTPVSPSLQQPVATVNGVTGGMLASHQPSGTSNGSGSWNWASGQGDSLQTEAHTVPPVPSSDGDAPSSVIPGRSDLELLEELKKAILEGQHPIFRATPNPIALAQLWKGPMWVPPQPTPTELVSEVHTSAPPTESHDASGRTTEKPVPSAVEEMDGTVSDVSPSSVTEGTSSDQRAAVPSSSDSNPIEAHPLGETEMTIVPPSSADFGSTDSPVDNHSAASKAMDTSGPSELPTMAGDTTALTNAPSDSASDRVKNSPSTWPPPTESDQSRSDSDLYHRDITPKKEPMDINPHSLATPPESKRADISYPRHELPKKPWESHRPVSPYPASRSNFSYNGPRSHYDANSDPPRPYNPDGIKTKFSPKRYHGLRESPDRRSSFVSRDAAPVSADNTRPYRGVPRDSRYPPRQTEEPYVPSVGLGDALRQYPSSIATVATGDVRPNSFMPEDDSARATKERHLDNEPSFLSSTPASSDQPGRIPPPRSSIDTPLNDRFGLPAKPASRSPATYIRAPTPPPYASKPAPYTFRARSPAYERRPPSPTPSQRKDYRQPPQRQDRDRDYRPHDDDRQRPRARTPPRVSEPHYRQPYQASGAVAPPPTRHPSDWNYAEPPPPDYDWDRAYREGDSRPERSWNGNYPNPTPDRRASWSERPVPPQDDRRNGAGTYDRSRPNGPHHYPPAHAEHDTYTRTRARSPSPMRPHESLSDSRPAQKKMRESYDGSQGWSHSHPHSHFTPPSSAHSHPPVSSASSTSGGWPSILSGAPPSNGPNGGVKDYRPGGAKESWTRPNMPASYDRPVSPGLDRYGSGGGQSTGYGRPPPGPANAGTRYGRGPPGR